MVRLPKMGQIFIAEAEGVGGAEARIRTGTGYLVRIQAPAFSYEVGLRILHEYLDELGYDNNIRKDVNG